MMARLVSSGQIFRSTNPSIVENDVMEMTRVHVETGMHVSGSTTRRPIANTRAQGGQASAIK
jgi:hypothetical protein